MKLNKPKSEDKKIFVCPQCDKPRMVRPLDHKVDITKRDFKSKDGSTVSLMADTCDNCFRRNYKLYFEPSTKDVRNILKSMTDTKPTEDSLENLL